MTADEVEAVSGANAGMAAVAGGIAGFHATGTVSGAAIGAVAGYATYAGFNAFHDWWNRS